MPKTTPKNMPNLPRKSPRAASRAPARKAASTRGSAAARSSLEIVKEDLVAANRILAHHGVLDAFGHVSARDPGNPGRFLISRSRAPELVAVGDLMISVKDESGAEIQQLALSLRTTLSAAPAQGGGISLTVGTPELFAQVLAQSDVVDRPLTDEQVEGIVGGAWGLVGGQADAALANLPMPAIAGIQLGTPTIEGRAGYVFADVPLQ